MKQISEPIVFFGSGPVAARSLELLATYTDIEAVVTKPRPEHHRGPVPVLDLAQQLGLRVETVANKRQLDELIATRPFRARVGILIDFGIIVSQAAIDYFPLGIINSHFSLLPEWRGADPITFSLLSGQKTTGVSLMLLVEKMDEGPLLAQGTYDINPTETNPELTSGLIDLSDSLLQHILPEYLTGSITPYEQSEHGPDGMTLTSSYSRKLTKQDSVLDTTKSAEVLEREVRAFIEWPKTRITLGDVEITITASHALPGVDSSREVYKTDDGQLAIGCADNTALVIDRLKPAGKQEMTSQDFLRGYGDRITL